MLANVGFDSGSHYWEITIDAFVDIEDIFIGISKNYLKLDIRATDSK